MLLPQFHRVIFLQAFLDAFLASTLWGRLALLSDYIIFLAGIAVVAGLLFLLRKKPDLAYRPVFLIVMLCAFLNMLALSPYVFALAGPAGVGTASYIKIAGALGYVFLAGWLWDFLLRLRALPGPRELRLEAEELLLELQALREDHAVLQGQAKDAARDVVQLNKDLAAESGQRRESEELLRTAELHLNGIINNAVELIAILDGEGRFEKCSPSLQALLGWPDAGEKQGSERTLYAVMHREDIAAFRRAMGRRLPYSEESLGVEFRLRREDGGWVWVEGVVKTLWNGSSVRNMILQARDVTKQRQIADILLRLPDALAAVAASPDAAAAMREALEKISELMHWDYAEAWIPQSDGKILECSPAWFGNESFANFRRVSQELRFAPDIGLMGRIWRNKQPEWLQDASRQAMSVFFSTELARDAGIKAVAGVPVLAANNKMLAVLIFMAAEARPRDEQMLGMMATVAAQLALAMEHKGMQEILRDTDAQLELRVRERTGELSKTVQALETAAKEQKAALDAAQQSLAQYRGFVEGADAILWTWDVRAARMAFISPQVQKLLGYAPETCLGEPAFWQDHIHGGDRNAVLAFRKRLLSEKREGQCEYRMITTEGRSKWFREMVRVQSEEGRAVKLSGIMVDITQKKLEEEALAQERDFVSSILDTASAYVLVLDTEGKIMRCNKACETWAGTSRQALKEKYFWDLFPSAADADEVKNIIQRLMAGQFPLHHDSSESLKTGGQRVIAWSDTVLFNKENEPVQIIAAGVDITRRKEMEQRLKKTVGGLVLSKTMKDKLSDELLVANEKLRRLDEMKSHFISAASHELKTPLTSIKGYLETVLHDDVGPLNAKQRDFLQNVLQSAERLHRLVNELLDISKIEAGHARMRKGFIEIVPLLKEEMVMFKKQAQGKGISMDLDADIALKRVRCDADKIKEALDNLIGNAIKYTPRDGKIRIAARNHEKGIRIDVQDTGIGIRREDQERIFEPFVRIEKDGSEQYESTGLGLTLVKKIIEAHAGQIKVQSQEGKGTTFTLILPADHQPETLLERENNGNAEKQ